VFEKVPFFIAFISAAPYFLARLNSMKQKKKIKKHDKKQRKTAKILRVMVTNNIIFTFSMGYIGPNYYRNILQ